MVLSARQVHQAAEQVRLEDEQQKAEESERQRQAILAAEAARERQKQEEIQLAKEAERERKAYIQRYIVTPGNRDGLGVAVVFRSSFDNDLAIDGIRPFLTQAAINDGVFTRLATGNKMEIDRLELGGNFSKIVLGRHNETLESVEAIQGSMKSVRRLDITVLNFSASSPGMTSYSLRASVLGQNSDIASQRSLADLKGQFAELWATLSE